jgi:uncharacterized iron-regulated membrane protein
MNEASLRKWHRTLGIILALFIFVQAATGALMALQFALNFPEPLNAFEILHTGGGLFGSLYRILLGLGLMVMAASGSLIYLKIRARTKK